MSDSPHSLTAFKRPHCPHCQAKMMLERASAGPMGSEHRLFECPKCDHVENVVVAPAPFKSEAPFKSKALGWLSGELGRAPVTHDIKDGKLMPRPAE